MRCVRGGATAAPGTISRAAVSTLPAGAAGNALAISGGVSDGGGAAIQIGAAEIGDAHPRRAGLHHIQQFGRPLGQIDDAAARIGPAVIDPHDDAICRCRDW